MHRKGIIDVSLVSWIVLIAVFFLMALFILISSGINFFGDNKKVDYDLNVKEIDSKVMLSLFLHDFVVIDGIKVNVKDVLGEMGLRAEGEEPEKFKDLTLEELTKVIEEKFNLDYSCNMKNSLFVEQDLSAPGEEEQLGVKTIWAHIAYPDAYGRNPLGKDEIILNRKNTIDLPVGSYYFGLTFDGFVLDIYAKMNSEKLRC